MSWGNCDSEHGTAGWSHSNYNSHLYSVPSEQLVGGSEQWVVPLIQVMEDVWFLPINAEQS